MMNRESEPRFAIRHRAQFVPGSLIVSARMRSKRRQSAIAALVLDHCHGVAPHQTLKSRAAQVDPGIAAHVERCGATFDIAVVYVDDSPADDHAGCRRDDTAVGDVKRTPAAYRDCIAVDIDAATIEAHRPRAVADDRVYRPLPRLALCGDGLGASGRHDADTGPCDSHPSLGTFDRVILRFRSSVKRRN